MPLAHAHPDLAMPDMEPRDVSPKNPPSSSCGARLEMARLTAFWNLQCASFPAFPSRACRLADRSRMRAKFEHHSVPSTHHPHALRLDSESPCRRRPSPLTAQTWLAASTPKPEGVLASAARTPRSAVRYPGRGITTDGRRPCLGSSGAYQTGRARTDQAQRPLSHPHTRTGELRGGESGRLGGQYRRGTKDCLLSEQEFRRLAAQRACSISQRRP